MLHRNKAPNKGKWNGVGGHIETGRIPISFHAAGNWKKKPGLKPDSIHFGGILTWEGFEINIGGLYIFSAEVNSWEIRENGEGNLKWQPTPICFFSSGCGG